MNLAQSHLTILLNALYELGERRLTVDHPAPEIGTLLEIHLDDPSTSTVSVRTGAVSYEACLEEIQLEYGQAVREELPNEAAYIKALVASGLADIENRDEVEEVIDYYGYPDLENGHAPRYAGFDTNLLPWRMQDVLELDPERYSGTGGRAPVNGFTLPAGVDEELRISHRYGDDGMPTSALADAFGNEFERLAGQPTEDNRETRLGLREYRRLSQSRPHDIVASDRGDEAIIESCLEYYADEPTGVVLFSNDYGFIDRAKSEGIPAVHVAFPVDVPRRLTGAWGEIATLLYVLAVTFGVIVLPKATLYGVWEDKQPQNWHCEEIHIDARSDQIATLLERDKPIVDAHSTVR